MKKKNMLKSRKLMTEVSNRPEILIQEQHQSLLRERLDESVTWIH